jgi:hypothetical protein
MTINAKSVSLYAFPSLIFLMHHAIAFPAGLYKLNLVESF